MSAPPSNASRESPSACVPRRSNRCRGSPRRWAVRNCTSSVTTWPADHSVGTRPACWSTCWARPSPKGRRRWSAVRLRSRTTRDSPPPPCAHDSVSTATSCSAGCARATNGCRVSLLLDHLYGATIELVGDDRAAQIDRLTNVPTHSNARGAVVYRAPQASEVDKPLHAAAYAGAAVEMLEQAPATGIDPTHVYCSSLDTTHAGLLLGLRAAGSTIELRAISPNERAIFADRTIEDEVARLVTAAGHLLGLAVSITAAERVDIDRARRSPIRGRDARGDRGDAVCSPAPRRSCSTPCTPPRPLRRWWPT